MDNDKFTTWIDTARAEEQGSFCDRATGNQYENTSLQGAIQADQEATQRGDGVMWWSSSLETGEDVPRSVDRWNVTRRVVDDQGQTSEPRLGPGR